MDPNSTTPNINPATAATPAMPAIPPAPSSVAQPAPVAPAAPAMPEIPAAPSAVAQPAPVAPTTSAMPEMPAPVAPVINPTGVAAAADSLPMPDIPTPTAPVFQPGDVPTPVAPVFQPGDVMIGATDPITMPNPPKEVDPIEEELNAPMKAAGPVPGSIGSAISMTTDGTTTGQTPNVAFNDPAMAQNNTAKPKVALGKSLDKKTLIILCAIAGVVVLALAVVLIMQML